MLGKPKTQTKRDTWYEETKLHLNKIDGSQFSYAALGAHSELSLRSRHLFTAEVSDLLSFALWLVMHGFTESCRGKEPFFFLQDRAVLRGSSLMLCRAKLSPEGSRTHTVLKDCQGRKHKRSVAAQSTVSPVVKGWSCVPKSDQGAGDVLQIQA